MKQTPKILAPHCFRFRIPLSLTVAVHAKATKENLPATKAGTASQNNPLQETTLSG